MIPDLYTGQPLWLIIFCLVLAAGYAFALYFRDTRNEFHPVLKGLLGVIRFLAVFIISFMLLAPFIRSIFRDREKPVIILAVDNSQSIVLNSDSSFYRDKFLEDLNRVAKQLGQIAEVRPYLFGEHLTALTSLEELSTSAGFHDRLTNLSGLFPGLNTLYYNRNVGALIIASDGIYNTGSNPVYQAKNWPYPIYTIAMGDTNVRMDLIITRVNYNRMVYLNNQFPVEMVIHADAMQGMQSRLSIYHEGKRLYSQEFFIDRNDFTTTFAATLDAAKSGLQKYVIVADPVEGELSFVNNRKEIFIEVLDARNRVLILSAAPHPDISALKQAIGSNLNYEVEDFILTDFNGPPEAYNLVIMHQLPSVDEPAESMLRLMEEKGIPVLFILGGRSDLVRFNKWTSGLNLVARQTGLEEVLPVFDRSFSAFSISDETRTWLSDLPPLLAPPGEYQVANNVRTMLFQRIGMVETSRPLIMFADNPDGRKGVIAGEGLWKWRLFNYAKSKDHRNFNEIVNKMIQFLSLREQKKNFRVYHTANFTENKTALFEAEVYNNSYELITDPEVEMIIRNEDDVQFPFTFNRSGNAYLLDAGKFPPGNYVYEARTESDGKKMVSLGQFSISAIDLEALNTIADHPLLYQLANDNGGKMYYPDELALLADDLIRRDDIRTVTYSRTRYDDLLNKEWVLILMIVLLALEWFLRKWAGSY